MAGRLIAVAAASLALASPAAAQTPILDAAVEGLRGHPVYLHPGTNVLTKAEAQRLEQQIEDEGRGPVYIAILPGAARHEAGGRAEGVVLELSRRIVTSNPPAIHAAVVGNQFRAINRDIPAGDLATRAFRARSPDGVAAVLSDFVSRVGAARANPTGTVEEEEEEGGLTDWLIPIAGGIAVLLLYRAYRGRRERSRQLTEVKTVAREDLVALADDVVGLDEEVESNPEAKAAYLRGMEAYQRADDAFDRASSPRDISKVTEALAESRYEMETAKALLAGREPPERRAPCFFDPRHGTSVEDVMWTTPDDQQIEVPVCEADARRLKAGREPDVRQIRGRPFWDAPAYFHPWALGFFALGGFAVGSAFGPDEAAADPGAADSSGDDFGGGDFGGGDWGGGDFGGGDFGGGGDGGG